MDRDSVRLQYEKSKLNYSDFSSTDFFKLRELVSKELDTFLDLKMKVTKHKKRHLTFTNDGAISHGGIRVKSDYFDDREAITFNREGFIGFAGWADSKNVQPFVKAFSKFINIMMQEKSLKSLNLST